MINCNIDLAEFKELLDVGKVSEKAVQEAAAHLTMALHGKIKELAQQKLHSRRKLFLEHFHYDQVDEDTWVVTLDAEARWIDDGSRPHDMLEDLLKSPKAKTAKDGSKYLVVPFKHGPGLGKGTTTPAQQDLTSAVKSEMRSRGIPFGSIERDAAGAAKVGRLHSFSIDHNPQKTSHSPQQGRGPIGDVRQGPNQRQVVGGGPSGGGTPFLKNVSVYQTPDASRKSGVRRDIMTFRVASSKHRDQDRWQHPGNEAMNLMEEGLDSVLKEFQSKIAPEILAKIKTELGEG